MVLLNIALQRIQKKWYLDINSVLNKYGIGHALWSYKEMDFDFKNPRLDAVRKDIIKK